MQDDAVPDDDAIDAVARVLDDVEDALARLEDRSFGTCEVCGQPIEPERLTGQPTVRTCERHPQLTDPASP